jgi:hypothetical protein
MVFAGSSPITTTSPSSKAHQKSGPFPQPALPGFDGHTTPSDSRHGRRLRDVEAATLALDGSPPITRTTFPTCRAHYPGGSSGCACRLLPRSYSLPQMAGGSASALSLSRPAQASLTLRPAGLLNRLKAAFVTRLQPCRLPGRAARQLPDQSTILWVESSSTSDPRLRGALPIGDIEWLTSRPSTMSAASHPSDTAPRSSALRSARNSVQCPSRMRRSSASEPADCRGRNLLATECNS